MTGLAVLIGTIICSSLLTILFKYFDKFKVKTDTAIVINYFVASTVAFGFSKQAPSVAQLVESEWLWSAVLLGFLFISLFNLLAITSQKVGVAEANVANKVTFIFPTLMSYFLYSEDLNGVKLTGIFLAIVAVLVSANKGKKGTTDLKIQHPKKQLYLIILFLGGGLLDMTLSYSKGTQLQESELSIFTGYSFLLAGILGSIHLIYQLFSGKKKIKQRDLIGGVTLGCINYFSIFLFLSSLNYFSNGTVFPTVNMGVIIGSSLLSWALFKERLTKTKIIAILLACVAIGMVSL